MTVRLVLDTSAVVAYGAGSVHVWETLTQVVENSAEFAVTALSLAAAAHTVGPAWLRVLEAHEAYVGLPVIPATWPHLSAAHDLLGRWDCAVAVEAALRLDCEVLTAEPDAYKALGDAAPIIPV